MPTFIVACQQPLDALLHLACGLVRERHGENALRSYADALDEMRDAVGNRARLSAAGARKDQDRSFGRCHCVALCGIEAGEMIYSSSHYSFTGTTHCFCPVFVLKSEPLAEVLSNSLIVSGRPGSGRIWPPFVIAQRCSHEMPTGPVY